ncbi:MAG: hypothetical protein JSU72_11165 [Deltaproteobacteria bacterium]|nr:MAG: hypothetical protein JSU72_11165 [Deltaproteobacteria bacterium]
MKEPTYVKPGIPVYSHRDGKGANRVRFLAWKDSLDFIRRLWIHPGLGACLNRNWNEPCPVCEEAKRQLDQGTGYRKLVREGLLLGKTPRILAQIIDRNDEETGVQIWDVAGSEIEIAIMNLSVHKEYGLIIPWTDPNYGYDLIYDYDSRSDDPKPRNLRRSWQSKLNKGLYDGVMDFDEEIINRLTHAELATICVARRPLK